MAQAHRAAGGIRPALLAERIVEETLELAEEVGWEGVRLRLIAERCGVPLADVGALYRDIDAVADAWFENARTAMLVPAGTGLAALPARDRLHAVLMSWFDALAPYRRVTVEMIRAKLYPSHPHQWVPLIFNLSRTVQWWRDAAGLDATGWRRQVEEVGLTLLFLRTLAVWANDNSPDQQRTRDWLRDRLARADGVMARLWPPEGEPAA